MSAEIKHEIRIARTRQKITKRMKIINFNFLIFFFFENTMITIARKAIIKKLFIVTFRFDLFT